MFCRRPALFTLLLVGGRGRTAAAALTDRFGRRDEDRPPAATSVRADLAASPAESAGTQLRRWVFSPLHKQTWRAQPSQAADRRRRQIHRRRGRLVQAPAFGRTFPARRSNKTTFPFFTPSWQNSRLCVEFGNGFPKVPHS